MREVKVGRYVYHLTQKHKRKSILKYGLKGSTNQKLDYQQAVFAHDSNLLTSDWFYVMDMVNIERSEILFFQRCKGIYDNHALDLYVLAQYVSLKMDIWRIDTYMLDRKWFLDENLGFSQIHVVSFGDIPAQSIQLCLAKGTDSLIDEQMQTLDEVCDLGFIPHKRIRLESKVSLPKNPIKLTYLQVKALVDQFSKPFEEHFGSVEPQFYSLGESHYKWIYLAHLFYIQQEMYISIRCDSEFILPKHVALFFPYLANVNNMFEYWQDLRLAELEFIFHEYWHIPNEVDVAFLGGNNDVMISALTKR
jgi:hypothetical protein